MGDADKGDGVHADELDTVDGVDRGDRSRPASLVPSPVAKDYPDLVTVDRRHYQRGNQIASGGMGLVVEARDLRLGRDVAIKELLPSNRDAARRFEREARITARLQHPSIIQVYEAGVWPGGEPFFAMTRVPGRSLDKVVAENGDLDERLMLIPNVIAVADALAYAHNENVIHRDLKPANVLIGEFGDTVVIDWGLAKEIGPAALGDAEKFNPIESMQFPVRASAEETNAGSVVGTPAYMPPEQARGETVDQRADVYSLGALLYHVLAGCAPYPNPKKDPNDVLARVKAGPCEPLARREPNTPADLIAIVEKAMARDPDDRHANAGELVDELRRFQSGQLLKAKQYSRPELFRRWFQKYKVVIGIVTVALVVLGVVGTFSISRILDEKRKDERRRNALLEERGRTELLAGQTGRAVAYLFGAGEDNATGGARGLLIADAIRPFEAQLATFPSAAAVILDPSGRIVTLGDDGVLQEWSRDGTRGAAFGAGIARVLFAGEKMVTVDRDRSIRVWSNGVVERELHGHTADILDAHASTDGRYLVTGSADNSARVWDLETGAQVHADCGDGSAVVAVRLSPDGERVVSATDDDVLCYWWARTGEQISLLRGHRGRVRTIRWSPDPDLDRPIGALVLTASEDGTAQLWDAFAGKPVISPLVHDGHALASAEFSPDGGSILTAGADHVVRLWAIPDVLTEDNPTLKAKELRRFVGHAAALTEAVFDATGKRIATASIDGKAKVWDVDNGELVAAFEHAEVVTSIAFTSDGQRLLTASRDHVARLWDLGHAVGKPPHEVDSVIHALATSPDNSSVAAAADDSVVTIWRASGEPLALHEHNGRVFAVAYSRDGRLLASGGEDAGAILWDATTGKKTAVLGPHAGAIRTLAFAPDGQLATAGDEGVVRLWTAGKPSGTLRHDKPLLQLAYAPDGSLLAGVDGNGRVVIWSLAGGTAVTRRLTTSGTRAIAFSRDGTRFVASGTDTKIYAIDRDGIGPLALDVDGPTDEVHAVAFTRDGSCVITAGANAVQLWDASKGKLVGTRGSHAGSELSSRGGTINALAVSNDGSTLWSGGTDPLVRGWDIHTESRSLDALEGARQRVPWRLGDDDIARLVEQRGDNDGR